MMPDSVFLMFKITNSFIPVVFGYRTRRIISDLACVFLSKKFVSLKLIN